MITTLILIVTIVVSTAIVATLRTRVNTLSEELINKQTKIEVLQTDANAQNLRILQQETELNNLREGATQMNTNTIQPTTIPTVVVELLKNENVRNELVELLERASANIPMTRPQLQELEAFMTQLKASPKTLTAFVENVGKAGKSTIEKVKNGFLGAINGAKNGLNK